MSEIKLLDAEPAQKGPSTSDQEPLVIADYDVSDGSNAVNRMNFGRLSLIISLWSRNKFRNGIGASIAIGLNFGSHTY